MRLCGEYRCGSLRYLSLRLPLLLCQWQSGTGKENSKPVPAGFAVAVLRHGRQGQPFRAESEIPATIVICRLCSHKRKKKERIEQGEYGILAAKRKAE